MNLEILYQWREEIARHMRGLNSWQVENVALFSQGVIHAESSQQDRIARKVVCGERASSAARRFRRFLDNERLDMSRFYTDWTSWILSALPMKKLYLCVDETKISATMAAMVVGVAWSERCIPLAWRCYNPKNYPVEGQVKLIEDLLQSIQSGMSEQHEVCLLADRGIGTSPDLCAVVTQLGWTYLFRVTGQSKIVTELDEFTIYKQVQEGQRWQASGLVFKKRGRIPAHAIALWSVGYDEPWALVTNDERLSGYEYAHRNWQEQSFRDLKSSGWQWDESHIRHPDHMQRLMILLVLAYAWTLALGTYAVEYGFAQPLQKHKDGALRRHWSLFKEGLQFFTDWVLKTGVCLKLLFIPDKRFT